MERLSSYFSFWRILAEHNASALPLKHRKSTFLTLKLNDEARKSRADVDALTNTVREVNASRGVLFSVMGFESGAITQAKADGIELFTVRELTDEEWGLPRKSGVSCT